MAARDEEDEMADRHAPPMDPSADAADARRLGPARARGDARGRALELIITEAAGGDGSIGQD